MKFLKKTLALLLAAAMVFSLAACDTTEEETEGTAAEETAASDTSVEAEDVDSEDSSDIPVLDGTDYIDSNGFFKGVTASDYITLPDLTKIEIPYDEYNMSDEDYQEEVDYVIEAMTTTEQVTNRAVVDGDTVHIVYTGSIDGVEFSGGATGEDGTDVTIGVTSYIDDFLEQLIGHKPGETVNVEVTFPESYPQNTDLEGKDALFVTTIEYISETVTPEFNDALIAQAYGESAGWNTVEEFAAGVKASYRKSAAYDYVLNYIKDNGEIDTEFPEVCENYIKTYYQWLMSFRCATYGYTEAEYYSSLGYTDFEEYYAAMADTITAQITNDLIYQALCEHFEFEPTNSDVLTFLEATYGSSSYQSYYDSYMSVMSSNCFLHTLLGELSLDKVLETGVIYLDASGAPVTFDDEAETTAADGTETTAAETTTAAQTSTAAADESADSAAETTTASAVQTIAETTAAE